MVGQRDLCFRREKRSTHLKCSFGRYACQCRIVRALGEMRKYDVFRRTVEIVRHPVGEVFVGKMSAFRRDPLFEAPVVNGAGAKHIAAMVRFYIDKIAAIQFFTDQLRHVPEIGQSGDTNAAILCYETEIIDGVVRDRERLKIDIADAEMLIRLDADGAALHRLLPSRGFVPVSV